MTFEKKTTRDYILCVSNKMKKPFPVMCKDKQIMYNLSYTQRG